MIFKRVKEIAKEKKWWYSKSMVAGFENGYLVNIGDKAGAKLILFPCLKITPEQQTAITNQIDTDKKNKKIDVFIIEEDFLLFELSEQFVSAKKDKILEIIEYGVTLLQDNNIEPTQKCSLCGVPEFDMYYADLLQQNLPFCKRCFDDKSNEIKTEKQKYMTENKKYMQGLLGAIICAAPLALIYFLPPQFMKIGLAGASFIIARVTLFGYNKFGGKTGLSQKWILLFADIGIISVMFYTYVRVVMHQNNYSSDRIYEVLFQSIRGELPIIKFLALCGFVSFLTLMQLFIANRKHDRLPTLFKSEKYD